MRSEALPPLAWLARTPTVHRSASDSVQTLLAARLVGTVLVSLNQGDVWLSGHVTTRVLVKSLLTPINSIERMTLGSDKRFSGELPGHTVGLPTGIWRHRRS